MGWGSGSRVAEDLIKALSEVIDDDYDRKEFYEKMIEVFEDHDCDTLDECQGIDPAFDEAWEEHVGTEQELDWSED